MKNKMSVEQLLPYVDEALGKAGILVEGKVPETYERYIAAFGATVINMGIKAALFYYRKDHQNYVEDKVKMSKDSTNPPGSKANVNDVEDKVNKKKMSKEEFSTKVYRTKVVMALEYILSEANAISGLKKVNKSGLYQRPMMSEANAISGLKKETVEDETYDGRRLMEKINKAGNDYTTLFDFTRKIVDASVALKLIVRTYPVL